MFARGRREDQVDRHIRIQRFVREHVRTYQSLTDPQVDLATWSAAELFMQTVRDEESEDHFVARLKAYENLAARGGFAVDLRQVLKDKLTLKRNASSSESRLGTGSSSLPQSSGRADQAQPREEGRPSASPAAQEQDQAVPPPPESQCL